MVETRHHEILPFDGVPDLTRPRLVGIGGAGMSGLARLLVARGSEVSGSDLRAGAITETLATVRCTVHVGHRADSVGEPTAVVWSSGIAPDNVEIAHAVELGLPVLHRSQALGHLLAQAATSVVVAGTHGKSTTTAMLGTMLGHLGASWVGGGALVGGENAHAGHGGILVAEGDESDRTLVQYRPDVAVVLNVDDDHPETYVDRDDVLDVFETFAGNSAHLVVSADDEGARLLTERVRARSGLAVTTVGKTPGTDFRVISVEARGEGSRVVVREPGGAEAVLTVPVPGRVNALNAAVAYACGRVLDADHRPLLDALAAFPGVQRRMTPVGTGEESGITVRDSFAHHARAVEADIATGRELASGRVIVVFEPSGGARTLAHGEEIGRALAAADEVVLLDVHSLVGTATSDGVTSDRIAAAVAEHGGRVTVVREHAQAVGVVRALVGPGDLVITMGTGEVTALGPQILALDGAAVLAS